MRRFQLALVALLVSAGSVSAQTQAAVPSWRVTPPVFVMPASAVNGGGTFTGQLFGPTTPTDCSTADYSFTGDPDTGVGYSTANAFFLCAGGSPQLGVSGGVVEIGPRNLSFGAGFGSPDVTLVREGADHLFQRRTTNAQRASWANTYTSSTNYEAFSIDWQTAANVAIVGTRTAATGTGRRLNVFAQASNAGIYSGLSLTAGSAPSARIGLYDANLSPQTSSLAEIVRLGEHTNNATSGTNTVVTITPTYNQSSGTAANTDLLINRTETAVGSGAQYAIQTQRGSTNQFTVTAGSSGKGLQIGTAQAAVPTCSSNCGTSPSVVGSDSAMRVTMGSSGVPASGWVVTFNGTWPTAPVCTVNMAKTGMVTGKDALTVVTTTTTITVVTNGTAPATTDVYSIICLGVQ